MATAWQETTGSALANIAGSRDGMASSALPQRLMPSDGEPSKPMLAVVHEFAIRWPCPKDTDPDFYSARLKMLARDCGEMSPGLLRKAGDYVARIPGRFNTMPSASELYQAAEQVIADRAAKQVAEQRQHAAEQGRPMPQPAMGKPRPGDLASSLVDASYAWDLLGWRPTVDLSAGIRETARYFAQT